MVESNGDKISPEILTNIILLEQRAIVYWREGVQKKEANEDDFLSNRKDETGVVAGNSLLEHALLIRSKHVGKWVFTIFQYWFLVLISLDPTLVTKILSTALSFLISLTQTILVLRTLATCYFHLASIESHLIGAKV